MKRYYNATTDEWYTEGGSLTKKEGNKLYSGVPTEAQLKEWGFEEYITPAPKEPTEADLAHQRMNEIQTELSSMDYLTSKFIDGEDMSEYGDWQGKRKALREEYRNLEKTFQMSNEETQKIKEPN